MRAIWVVAEGTAVTPAVVAEALAAGATEVVVGIPPELVGVINAPGFWQIADPVRPLVDVNVEAIVAGLNASLATMTTIITTAPANVTTVAQAQAAIRQSQQAIQAEALAIRRLIRLALGLLDGTD